MMKMMRACMCYLVAFLLICSSSAVNSQAVLAEDSCNSPILKLNGQLPFNMTSSFGCSSLWEAQNFILRYSQTSTNLWSFILSAPNKNTYIAVGFSSDGGMVESTSMVGCVTADDGAATMRKYHLGGKSENQVTPIQILGNSTSIIHVSSRMYMAFQLTTPQPEKRLICAVGRLPICPSYLLSKHSHRISVTINYATGEIKSQHPYSNLRRSHGMLNMVGWGILIPIGAMVGRYMKRWQPIWFYLHITIQSLGLICGSLGVVCGFLLNSHLNYNVNTHKIIGLSILSLGCLQVIAALARPEPGSRLSRYWKWYHHVAGQILIVLAVANVFYGVSLGHAGVGWNVGYGIVIGILFVVGVVLEVRLWMRYYIVMNNTY